MRRTHFAFTIIYTNVLLQQGFFLLKLTVFFCRSGVSEQPQTLRAKKSQPGSNRINHKTFKILWGTSSDGTNCSFSGVVKLKKLTII